MNKIKAIVVAGTLALAVSGLALASGGEISQSINAVVNGINMELNGQKINANTIVYKGRTYVAVRDIAEILGQEVQWKADSKTVNIVEPPENAVKVETKEIQNSNDVLDNVDLKIPVVSGSGNAVVEDALNAAFETAALTFRDKAFKEVSDNIDFAKKNGFPVRRGSVNTEFKVTYNANHLLSISVTYWKFTGGAHGDYNQVASNINLKTGEILSLKDLFKPGADYKSFLTGEIKKQINSDPERYFDYTMSGFKSVTDDQSFYISDTCLVIYFDPAIIAPYVSGIVEFKIPYSQMKDLINNKYKLNQK